MARVGPGWMQARAWLAIALCYLVCLNAVVLAAAPAQADGFGICAQDRSTPDGPRHDHKAHACCVAARCGMGAAWLGSPVDTPFSVERYARTVSRAHVASVGALGLPVSDAFRARGPPLSV